MNRSYLGVAAGIMLVCSVSAHAAGGLYGQITPLTEPTPAFADGFGHGSVSGITLSSDGRTAVVAAAGASVGGVRAGKVYIYYFAVDEWTLSQEIDDPAPVANDELGCAIAISGDGKSVLVGSQSAVNGQSYAGKAYLYTLNNTTWNLAKEFDDPAMMGLDSFGSSSALSGDGATAVIGAYATNANAGEAYIFHNVNGTWSLVKSIPDPDATPIDQFGSSVAISADGVSVIVGSNAGVNGNRAAGKAYLYTLSNGIWVQDYEFDDPAATSGDFFGGSSVAISGNGQAAVIGASAANGSSHGEGYIFSKANGTWMEAKAIADPDAGVQYGDDFGRNVAISGNGTLVLIGSNAAVGGQSYAGKAYLYALNNGQWMEMREFNDPASTAGDEFGYTGVALSADGETAFISAGEAIINNVVDAGEVYLYQSLDDLSIALSPDPSSITAGQQTALDFTVTNTDPQVSANNVTLTDILPSGLSYVSSNADGGSCSASGSAITCTLATLAPTGSWQPTMTVSASGTSTLTDTASVTNDEPDPNTTNNTATASITVKAAGGGNGGSGGGSLNLFALALLSGLLVFMQRRRTRR